MTKWIAYLQTAWRDMAAGMRRLLIGVLAAALVLIVLSFMLPPENQIWAVLGLLALFLLVQTVVLWQAWRQSPAVRRARRLYLAGKFAEAVSVLEADRASGRDDAIRDTLLGNAYRQLGQLAESETVLRAVYEADPDTPFSAYGLGRTLLAMGQYDDAAALIAHALDRRGQPVIVVDLAHAQFRAGLYDDAAASLRAAAEIELEPGRALLVEYLTWRLSGAGADEAIMNRLARHAEGLAVWQAEAERFATTPYGAALAGDVAQMQDLVLGD